MSLVNNNLNKGASLLSNSDNSIIATTSSNANAVITGSGSGSINYVNGPVNGDEDQEEFASSIPPPMNVIKQEQSEQVFVY